MRSITSALETIDSATRLPLINKPIDQIGDLTASLKKFQKELHDKLFGLSGDKTEMQVKDAMGRDGGKPILHMDGGRREPQPGVFIPVGSWAVP